MSPRVRKVITVSAAAVAMLIAAGLATLQWAPLYRLIDHVPRPDVGVFGDGVAIVAHRGWSAAAPENTLTAFEQAADLGVAIELDVHLCASGEVVVMHDETLERTTGGEGRVDRTDLSALSTLEAGAWFDARFAGEPIPTLRQVFERIGPTVAIDIELKTTPDKAALARAVVDEIRRAGRIERVIVSSFDPFLLEQVRLAEPTIRRGQLVATYDESDLAWHEKRALQNLLLDGRAQADLILVDRALLTEDWLDELKGFGYRVMVWTVDDPAEMKRWIDAGVHGIITNRPDVAAGVRGA